MRRERQQRRVVARWKTTRSWDGRRSCADLGSVGGNLFLRYLEARPILTSSLGQNVAFLQAVATTTESASGTSRKRTNFDGLVAMSQG